MKKDEKVLIGIIGGSGLCRFPELEKIKEIKFQTKYGYPSDKIIIGKYAGKTVAFLPRHRKNHSLPPHKIPYKANISALKKLGVEYIIATCIAGSLKRNIKPGDFVILDQFVNFTWGRDDYFEVEKKIVHLSMANPYCPNLRRLTYNCAKKLGIRVHNKGTVVVTQGPRFSTKAESKWFSLQKWDVVNMTQYPECYFAREMGICYVSIAMITDYDVGIKNHLQMNTKGMVKVLKIFNNNIEKVKKLIFQIIKELPIKKNCGCSKNLPDEYYKHSLKKHDKD
jgi:5'-methylthioadenosine phosphorylase